ncbi:hypothetical protein BD626DRAFT_494200 [Schizophyllum amplum]|uniref:Uncharacterized protein n=1 Tax=Schizophyllum amplum TaxID=97359 RepID=A0A550CEZ7_9AGAR|nr:hypothetical protein BD626DRAFT_494200 [Auriculariopsis ampla]
MALLARLFAPTSASDSSPDAIVQATLAAFSTSTIDILVNNAGVELRRLLVHVTPDDFARVFEVNVRGAMLLAGAAIPHVSLISPPWAPGEAWRTIPYTVRARQLWRGSREP